MRDGYRVLKPGLSMDAHQELARRLAALAAELTAIRDLIRENLGSATSSYQSVNKARAHVKHLRVALLHELVGEHADVGVSMAELRRVYVNDDGR
jgi:hypothetical protein